MVSTDPISDMLTRIRNAIAVSKSEVRMPYSKVKHGVADLLVANRFLKSTAVDGDGIEKSLVVTINDNSTVNSPITVTGVAGNAPATLSVSVNAPLTL